MSKGSGLTRASSSSSPIDESLFGRKIKKDVYNKLRSSSKYSKTRAWIRDAEVQSKYD